MVAQAGRPSWRIARTVCSTSIVRGSQYMIAGRAAIIKACMPRALASATSPRRARSPERTASSAARKSSRLASTQAG